MEKKVGLNNPLSALRHRNFALYAAGMCFSLIGTWMQNVAQPLLAFNLTNSSFLVGVITAMQFVPVLFFSLFSGVIIDRYSKKKILLFTQTASLMITLVLAVLVWTDKVQYWHILICSICLGIVNTLDMPTRQTFVIELVGKDDLLNAIAINSSIFNVARVAGPALAGLVMVTLGIFACFLFNSISFAAVILSLFFIKPNEMARPERKNQKIWPNVLEGLRYIRSNNTIIRTLTSVFTINGFAMSTNVWVTAFAKYVLAKGTMDYEFLYNYLIMFMGVGSFIGAMVIASMSRGGPHKIILKIYPYFIGGVLIIISFANSFLLTGLGLALLGFCFVSFTSTANSTVQYNTEDQFRGRVMSVYSLLSGGASPLGNLYAGAITQNIGARAGFRGSGLLILSLLAISRFLWAKSSRKKAEIAEQSTT